MIYKSIFANYMYKASMNNNILFLNFHINFSSRGPPCLLQLHLGVVSRERFSGLELIKEYLKNRQVDEVGTGTSSPLNT